MHEPRDPHPGLQWKAVLLLTLLAALAWWKVYRPARARRAAAEARVERLSAEIRRLRGRERRLQRRREALAAEAAPVVEEAIRATLHWGRPGEERLVLPEAAERPETRR